MRGPRAGFLCVFPDTLGTIWDDHGCGRRDGADDQAFIATLIAELVPTGAADPDRVFLTGVSSGATFLERLVRIGATQPAGIALITGTGRVSSHARSRILAPSTAVLLMAGTADPMVPYNGGVPHGTMWRLALRNMRKTLLDASAHESVAPEALTADWAAANHCAPGAATESLAARWPLVAMASVEALWGRDDDARTHAEQALVVGQQAGESFLVSSARFTLGFIELRRGRWEQAVGRLLEVAAPQESDTHPFTARAAIPDLVEAAVRAPVVAAPLERLRASLERSPTDAGVALLARCDALLDPAPEAFGRALARSDALSPFHRGRTELVYGEWLRRERRRQDARGQLRSALERFRSLRTTPWEARVEAELRATGETARRRDPSTLDQLTPQEIQVATLVAGGSTNKQIAAQLILSPRTIDYHLRKVFSKLGITSRTELVRHGLPGRASSEGA